MKIQNNRINEARTNFKKDLDAFSKKLSIKCSLADVRKGNCPWSDTSDISALMLSVVKFGALMTVVNIQAMLEGEA